MKNEVMKNPHYAKKQKGDMQKKARRRSQRRRHSLLYNRKQ